MEVPPTMRTPALARTIFVLVAVAALAAPQLAQGQTIPTATGRSIDLSRAGYKLFIPNGYVHRPQDATDLLVHFHGDPQTVWNNAAYAQLNAPVVTVNLGALSSSYQ